MPYEHDDVKFRYTPVITGQVGRPGSLVMEGKRLVFTILLPGQDAKMLPVRVSVFDYGDLVINVSDVVRVEGLPGVRGNRLELMCFGRGIEVLNRWTSGAKKKPTKKSKAAPID